jgi:hypothetical protein
VGDATPPLPLDVSDGDETPCGRLRGGGAGRRRGVH